MIVAPFILALLTQSGYASSPLAAIDAALAVAEVRADDVVFDIGSGDGRVVVFAAKKYGCRAVGIELDGNLVDLSRKVVLRNGVQNLVTILHEDALRSDLSSATVAVCYHQTEFISLLRPQLEKLAVGTRVIFLDYPPLWMNLRPVRTLKADQHEHSIYLWTVGACGVEDSPLVEAGKAYPGVRCFDGVRDPILVESAQWCAETLAAAGERAYKYEGHPDWDRRFRRIWSQTGSMPKEVSNYSSTLNGIYSGWAYGGTGHWLVISKPYARYGEGMARSRNNTWYGVVIVANN